MQKKQKQNKKDKGSLLIQEFSVLVRAPSCLYLSNKNESTYNGNSPLCTHSFYILSNNKSRNNVIYKTRSKENSRSHLWQKTKKKNPKHSFLNYVKLTFLQLSFLFFGGWGRGRERKSSRGQIQGFAHAI